MIIRWLKRLNVLKKVKLASEQAEFYYSKDVTIEMNPESEIVVHGKVTIGLPHPHSKVGFAAYPQGKIHLGKNAKIICEGDVFIERGCTILLSDGAELVFKGNNFLAHNTTIICKNRIEYGVNSSSAWNFTAIDDDDHRYFTPDGKQLDVKRTPIIIGDNVAIQTNVMIPRGLEIGSGAIVGAGTVLRQNVPSNSMVYHKNELKIRSDITYGFQFVNK